MRLFRPLEDILIADRGSRQRAAKQFVAPLVRHIRGDTVLKLSFGFHHGEGPNRIGSNPLEELMDAAHRACALVAASICEKRLEQALSAELIQDRDALNTLFQPDGPLGAFQTKATLAYLMGLITEGTFKDIKVIVRIRNDFAHKFDISSFDDQSIAARCANLKIPELHYYDITNLSDPTKLPDSVSGLGNKIGQDKLKEGLSDPKSRYVASCMIIANGISQSLAYPEYRGKPYI